MEVGSLCWMCAHPGTGGCCWDRTLTPVPGWMAVETVVDEFDSYFVIECPEYKEMDWGTRKRLSDRWARRFSAQLIRELTAESDPGGEELALEMEHT